MNIMSERYSISTIVQRELKARNLTADEILREALKIKTEGFISGDRYFPEGSVFIAWYKNKALSAVVKNGAIEAGDKVKTALAFDFVLEFWVRLGRKRPSKM